MESVIIDELIQKIKACKKCQIEKDTINKSIGRGSKTPKVLFIGLNPGVEENKTGRPFTGKSGKLLDKWANYLGLSKDDYAVVNMIRCFTTNESGLKGDEADKCFSYLEEQIQYLNPEFIFLLGNTVTKKVLNLDENITILAGRIFTKDDKHFYIPMPHPSYYVRNNSYGWEEDLTNISEFIKEPLGKSKPFDGWIEYFPGSVRLDLSDHRFPESEKIDFIVESTNMEYKPDIVEGFENVTSVGKAVQCQVPIHMHTTYSIKDSAMQVRHLAEQAKEMGYWALAITDHGTISGWYEFQEECNKNHLKAIFGIEFYVCNDYDEKTTKRYHLIALAKNQEGMKNIQRLVDISNRVGYYYKPRITLNHLFKYHEGLVVTTACALGVVAQRWTDGEEERAEEDLVRLKEVFGEDLYVELQPHDFDKQHIVNPVLIKLAEKYDLPLIITTDAHYLEQKDVKYHKALKAIVFQTTLEKSGFSIDSNYLMDSQDLKQRSLKMNIPKQIITQAFDNSKRIAQKCNARIKPFSSALPKFIVED